MWRDRSSIVTAPEPCARYACQRVGAVGAPKGEGIEITEVVCLGLWFSKVTLLHNEK